MAFHRHHPYWRGHYYGYGLFWDVDLDQTSAPPPPKTARLDNKYFELLDEKEDGQWIYQTYRPVFADRTMVLFSKAGGEPIAAFTLLANSDAQTLLTKRPPPKGVQTKDNDSEVYFQGMFNQDNCEFSMVLSNLSHLGNKKDIGFINFNVLHTRHEVREVDPGPEWSVNQVNELRPSESILVEADQRTNRSLVCRGAVKMEREGGGAVSVAADELQAYASSKQVGEGTQGTYFFPSVVGTQRVPEIAALFRAGTAWKCVQVFVRRMPNPDHVPDPTPAVPFVSTLFSSRGAAATDGADRGRRPEQQQQQQQQQQAFGKSVLHSQRNAPASAPAPSSAPPARSSSAQPSPPAAAATTSSTTLFSAAPAPAAASKQLRKKHVHDATERKKAERRSPAASAPRKGDSRPQSLPPAVSVQERAALSGAIAAVELNEDAAAPEALQDEDDADEALSLSKEVDGDVVARSQAGTVVAGSRVIHVQSAATGYGYAYDAPSQPCTLGLSIWKGMEAIPPISKERLLKVAAAIIADAKGDSSALLKDLAQVYPSEECVICLDDDISIDTVFLQCGHACCHSGCLTGSDECPLCRGIITAKMPYSAL